MKQKILPKPLKHRKLNRLNWYDYSQNGWYFVTICTKDRKEWFGEIQSQKMILNKIGNIVKKCFLEIPEHFSDVKLDEYVVMPNHIHGIIVINKSVGNSHGHSLQKNEWHCQRMKMTLPNVINGFKSSATRIIRQKHDNFLFVWQKSFHDHIIRNEKSLNNIHQYIINNPLKWETDENNPVNLKTL